MTMVYRVFAYFGLFSIFGILLYGFRHDHAAPWGGYAFNVLLYAAWVVPHLVMTRDWFKRIVYGSRAGQPIERQVYIVLTVVTWLAVLWLHRPMPGLALELPEALRFAATVGLLVALMSFFEGVTFPMIDGLLGVPGAAMSHSHGAETPLLTEGQYAQVRHPAYRAAILGGLCSLILHPNLAQVLWVLMIGATFVAFIPIEEAQLVAARGDTYRAYMQQTPWRLFRGVW
jgi:protein-S-isoprenylcysteine O-methyltransferase Ste14